MLYNSYNRYDGQWKQNQKDGKGILTDEQGVTIYEGTFKNGNKENGRGLLSSRKGQYRGQVLGGKRDGEGTMLY